MSKRRRLLPRVLVHLRRVADRCVGGACYGAGVAAWCCYGASYTCFAVAWSLAALIVTGTFAALCHVFGSE